MQAREPFVLSAGAGCGMDLVITHAVKPRKLITDSHGPQLTGLTRVTEEDGSCGRSTEAPCWACSICLMNIQYMYDHYWSWNSILLCLFFRTHWDMFFLSHKLNQKQNCWHCQLILCSSAYFICQITGLMAILVGNINFYVTVELAYMMAVLMKRVLIVINLPMGLFDGTEDHFRAALRGL